MTEGPCRLPEPAERSVRPDKDLSVHPTPQKSTVSFLTVDTRSLLWTEHGVGTRTGRFGVKGVDMVSLETLAKSVVVRRGTRVIPYRLGW